LGGTTWENPAPQGVGIFVSRDQKEVIEMTDVETETGTVRTFCCLIDSITSEEEKNV